MQDRPTSPPSRSPVRTRPPVPAPDLIPPSQVWTHLTQPQQEAVRQALLTLSRHLLVTSPPEVPHDYP